ncbi:MAG TPA: MBL fold metallo-hydrolase [Pyrinomonadaceae bacterium]|nr:MBL fold metallo-hydrolase [Pyrinomonadaceae bacterium]
MKLTVFQSQKGDCLLLTGGDGRMILVDGGMAASYSQHVAPALGRLRAGKKVIDVVYVSHIDQDHISGVLQMMDDEVEWRIHDFQIKSGNAQHKAPRAPRPPKVKTIWHNAFHEQVTKNAGQIEDMLAASAAILSGSDVEVVKALASKQGELATSIAEAIQLSRRVSPEQLGIKLNPPSKGKLMLVRDPPGPAIRLGGMRLRIIGPFNEDLVKLRKEWNAWLEKNQKRLASIKKQADEDSSAFGVKEISDLMSPKLRQAEELSSLLPLESKPGKFKLGARANVTTPNLASLMFLVEEAGKTVVLTGDGHQDDILKGLAHVKKLDGAGGIHVNVLKVQHHGSEHNIDEPFCRAVTADHYVFCGNGEHENPDLRVIQAIADSRIGEPSKLSPNSQAGDPFKFWFNSSVEATEKAEAKAHMKEIGILVRDLKKKSKGKLKFSFLDKPSFDLNV